MSAHPQSAGIAGFAFLLCFAMAGFVWVFSHMRTAGPAIREFIHWVLVPQFVMGMLGMAAMVTAGVLILAWNEGP